MSAVRLAVAGAGGRMGRALLEAGSADPGTAVAAALDVAGSPFAGRDAGELAAGAKGVRIGSDPAAALAASDVLVDFTRPAGTLAHLAACVACARPIVIGTTGFEPGQVARIREAFGIQGFFSIPGDEVSTFHLLSDYLMAKHLERQPGGGVVVTADLGFAKKGRNFAQKLNLPKAFIEKRRPGNDAKAQSLTVIGDVQGRSVILVDDEVDTAGTVTGAVNILKDHGAGDMYLCFPHAVLSPPAADRLRVLPIKEIITTNSVPLPPEKRLPNLTVLAVAPLLSEVSLRTHEGMSVGQMFNE